MSNPYVGIGTGPDTRGWSLWISSVVMIILAGLFVTARVAQRLSNDRLGADDWTLIASLLSSLILSICEIEAVINGYGAHYKTLTPAQASQARKWFYGAQVAYKVVLALNKAAICLMIYRIFRVSSKTFRWSCYVLLTFIIVSNTAFIIGTIFQCNPIPAFWDKTIQGAFCFNNTPWWLTYAVLQILLDVVLLTLPIKEVLKLKMSNFDKFGLILVFSTGLFVTVTSIYRATTLASSASSPDPTYGPIPATTWAVIEANSGIIAACLPLLRQPFVKLFRLSTYTVQTSRRRSRHGYIRERSNSQIEHTSSEQMIQRADVERNSKGSQDIYVMSAVSVTSAPRGAHDKVGSGPQDGLR